MVFEISKVANAVVTQSLICNCTLKEAWEKWTHPLITERFDFEEIENYINESVKLGGIVND